jgi:hypothetical protein
MVEATADRRPPTAIRFQCGGRPSAVKFVKYA